MMSPYFCCSALSRSLNTLGMNSDSLKSSAMMALPRDTIRRIACPQGLLSARKSTMAEERQMQTRDGHRPTDLTLSLSLNTVILLDLMHPACAHCCNDPSCSGEYPRVAPTSVQIQGRNPTGGISCSPAHTLHNRR